jgi:hypothetical protein
MTDSPHGAGVACLTDEMLAKYVDGTVTAGERTRVEEHLAACEYCCTLVADTARTADDLADPAEQEQPAAEVSHARPARSKTRALLVTGGLLAAASILLFLNVQRSPVDSLASVVGDQRLTVVRPTGGFAYGPLRSTLRGGETGNLALRAAEAELRERAARGSVADRHALGVAQLLLGQDDDSIHTLEAVVAEAPDTAAHHADLGAARLSRFLQSEQPEDAAAALTALDRALALDPRLPEVQFNRALLLAVLDRRDEAIAAWDAYLALDSTSAWADEARRQRAQLLDPSSR